MALSKITFTRGQGRSGRAATGTDHYSLLQAYYYATVANSAYAGIGNKVYNSILDAEADGVVNDYSDATAATSLQTVTTAGTNGDVVTVTVLDWLSNTIALGSYTKVTGDNTVTLVATAIVAAINARTYITGFSAVVGASGAYTITAPKRWGTFINTLSVVNTFSTSATMAITNVAFSGGTLSPLAMIHYQISETFRANPGCVLFFSLALDTSSNAIGVYNAQIQTDVIAAFNLFQGQSLQYAIYNPFRAFATSTLDAMKAIYNTTLAMRAPMNGFYAGKYTASALSALANTRQLLDDNVSAVIGQSTSGLGLELSKTQQPNVINLGRILGTTSAANVSQSIAETASFNVSDGAENETVGFYDGTDFTAIQDSSLADQLDDYGYIFFRKIKNFPGSYINFGNCAITDASDYANVEDNRTLNKAIRQVYQSLLTLLNQKNTVNKDGTLSAQRIAIYEERASAPLANMQRDTDINDFTVSVSATEVVATTKRIPVTIGIQQEPIGKFINVTIGFTLTV